ncbi:UNVERIFIED_CONTAM: hypothetical protein RMT77_014682 [Armadillidium vulgare]
MLKSSSSEDESDDEVHEEHPPVAHVARPGASVAPPSHDHGDAGGGTGPSLSVPGATSSLPG